MSKDYVASRRLNRQNVKDIRDTHSEEVRTCDADKPLQPYMCLSTEFGRDQSMTPDCLRPEL